MDAQLRALERDWQQSGDDAAGVRFLLASVRHGLGIEGLRLAAWAGFEPACRALVELGHQPPRPTGAKLPPLSPYTDEEHEALPLVGWLTGVAVRCGPEQVARLGAAVAWSLEPLWREQFPDDDRVRQALLAAEAWADCPCMKHATLARRAREEARQASAEARERFDEAGTAFGLSTATFGREDTHAEHDTDDDDDPDGPLEGYSLCQGMGLDVCRFQIAHLAQVVASVACSEGRHGIHRLARALLDAGKQPHDGEDDYDYDCGEGGGFRFGDHPWEWNFIQTDMDEYELTGWGADVEPAKLLDADETFELLRGTLIGWALGIPAPGIPATKTPQREEPAPGEDVLPPRLETREAAAKLASIAARHALSRWSPAHDRRPARAVEAAHDWAECPCPEHALQAAIAVDAAVDAMDAADSARARAAAEAAARAAEVVEAVEWEASAWQTIDAAREAVAGVRCS